jgi:hypothetical protein
MTSIGPYNQVYSNFNIDIPEQKKYEFELKENSVLHILTKTVNTTIFKTIIEKARMVDYFNNVENITLFVILDSFFENNNINVQNIDFYYARKIIYDSVLNFKLSLDIIKQNPVSKYKTKSDDDILITYIDGDVKVNNNLDVLQIDNEHIYGNNVIHFID